MSTLRVNTLQDATGSDQPAMAGAAKAWVNFNGEGTVAIRQAFNVSSITDNGTGNYTVNFTNAMVDADYGIAGLSSNAGNQTGTRELCIYNSNPPTISNATVITGASAATKEDVPYVCIAIFR